MMKRGFWKIIFLTLFIILVIDFAGNIIKYNSLVYTNFPFHAVNKQSKITFNVTNSTMDFNSGLFVLGTDSSPIFANGYIYVGSDSDLSYGSLFMLNASNISQMIHQFGNSDFWNSPTYYNGFIYQGEANSPYNFYQLNASDLSIVNKYNHPREISKGNKTISIGEEETLAEGKTISIGRRGTIWISKASAWNRYVYVLNYDDSKLYQFDASNVSQVIATHDTDGSGTVYDSVPVIANGYVYSADMNNIIYMLNASNITQEIHSVKLGKGLDKEYYGGSIFSSPRVYGNYVYVGSTDKNFYQLNVSTLDIISTFATGGEIHGSSPAYWNGYIYVGSWDHYVYQLNASNVSQMINKFLADMAVDSSPAVAYGSVYIGSGIVNDIRGTFYQLNATNISIQIANMTSIGTPSNGHYFKSSPLVAKGYVYVGSGRKCLIYQLNATNISL